MEKEKRVAKPYGYSDANIFDVFVKIAVTLTATGVIWLVAGVNEMQRDIDVIKVNQSSNKQDIDELRKFARKPRFSFDDFVHKIAPINQKLNDHEYKLRERGEWISATNSRISKLEGKYDVIIEKLTAINGKITVISSRDIK